MASTARESGSLAHTVASVAQSSVPNLPASNSNNASPTSARAQVQAEHSLGHRRHNSFSGGIDAHLVPWSPGALAGSGSLLEMATALLRTAPAAFCGAHLANDDELCLSPPNEREGEDEKEEEVVVAVPHRGAQPYSPHLLGHRFMMDGEGSFGDVSSIPEDEAYSSAPSTYRSSTSCDTSEYDQFSSSRSCIFTHSRTSSLVGGSYAHYADSPSVVMTHVRKPSSSSIQSAPIVLGSPHSHPLECTVTSSPQAGIFALERLAVASQETLRDVDGGGAEGEGEGGVSSGGETDQPKQLTEPTKRGKRKVAKLAKQEGPLLHRGIKSVEWIKRQLEDEAEPLVQVKVSSKTKHVVHFNVKAGDVVVWQFATKKKDIAFGVLFESTEVATEEAPPQEQEVATDKMLHILPILRVPSHTYMIEGWHTAPSDGFYVIAWDNTFSRFFAKDLFYCITTQSASPLPHDDRDPAHSQGEDTSQEQLVADSTHSQASLLNVGMVGQEQPDVVQERVEVAQDGSMPPANTDNAALTDCPRTLQGHLDFEDMTSQPSSLQPGQQSRQKCPVIDL